jgi:hypothetical protein
VSDAVPTDSVGPAGYGMELSGHDKFVPGVH